MAVLVTNLVARVAWQARSADWSAWHAQAAVMALVFVAAVAVFGLWAATGARRAAARAGTGASG